MKDLILQRLCLILAAALLIPAFCKAQNLTIDPNSLHIKTYKDPAKAATKLDAYNYALSLNDARSAAVHLTELCSYDLPDTVLYLRLCQVYFVTGQHAQGFVATKKFLDKYKDNPSLLEINAWCAERLEVFKTALEDYDKLFQLTQQINYYYAAGTMEYRLGRYPEAQARMVAIIKDARSEKITLPFEYQNAGTKQIPIRAVCYNLLGLMSYDIKDFKNADAYFSEAAKMSPDYQEAVKNLQQLRQPANEEKK